MRQVCILLLAVVSFNLATQPTAAQRPPSPSDVEGYDGLHQASHVGDVAAMRALVAEGSDLEARDRAGRTPLHVAAFASKDEAVRALAELGADLNALENQAYDIVTIAAVANAIHSAVGLRLRHAPMSPPRVLAALERA